MNTNRNDDLPHFVLSPQNADEFDDTDIGDCRAYQGNIYDEDFQIYVDENGNSVFSIVVPCRNGDDETDIYDKEPANYAYWEVRKIRDAIYGGVYEGKLLKSLPAVDGSAKWVKTSTMVAIKKMNCDHVMREANRSAERPLEEIKAMQYLQNHTTSSHNNVVDENLTSEDIRQRAEQSVMENHIMTSIDVITDNENLYLVMPFCDGREMFDVIKEQNFSEPEARYWFKQILKAVETLQEAGVCHRDMSLENMMVSGAAVNVIVIDFGMALKIPYIVDGDGRKQRCLIQPDKTCGKVCCFRFQIWYSLCLDEYLLTSLLQTRIIIWHQKYVKIQALSTVMQSICGR
jgi:hypothetical protein